MRIRGVMMALGAAGLLGACEMRVGDKAAGDNGAASYEPGTGEAQDGQFSLKAPGIDIALSIPDAIRARANIDSGGDDMVPPGVSLSGVHVDGLGGTDGRNSVELRFTSNEAPAALARWYNDAQARGAFTISGTVREGEGYAISGNRTGDGDPFTVRLGPRSGGTDGRIILSGGAH